MRRRTMVIVIILAAIFGFAIHSGPRLFRCYTYYRLILCNPSGLANLSGKVSKLDIPSNYDMPVLSLGYAQFGIRPDSVTAIKCTKHLEAGVIMLSDECNILFLGPWSSNWSATDANSNGFSRVPTIFHYDPFGYDFGSEAARAMPKTYIGIFFMEPRKFLEYLLLASAKSQNVMNQNGIGIFEAEHIRGIIRFGQAKSPGAFSVEVFSKQSNIIQDIRIVSNDPQKSKKVLLSILASYKFLIDEVPDEHTLQELVRSEIEKHDKFRGIE